MGRDRFVVQEHHASTLHWDFRLERSGVLKSWALPRGVPTDPTVNHLAIPTDDHDLSFASFEGQIPSGRYGAGRILIWDSGTYVSRKWIESEIVVELHGGRLNGPYSLFRIRGGRWLLHRMRPAA